MRVVFMGTPAFSVPVLAALLDAGHEIAGVYTQPDRPRGRGRRTVPSAVKVFATERHLAVYQPPDFLSDESLQKLRDIGPDVIVVAAYGLMLPGPVLDLPPLRCLNIHPSLLPRYRGASPVASAILNGDEISGVTVMVLDEGLDSGPILAQEESPVGVDETTEELTLRLFEAGARLLVRLLPKWERGETEARPQDESKATVTTRLTRETGRIDWGRSAAYITRQVRAFHPWPGSFTQWDGATLKIIEASVVESAGAGVALGEVTVEGGGLAVGTGSGLLTLHTVQLEGRRAIDSAEFLRGHPEFATARLG